MPRGRARIHPARLARREALLFEAGIKLGGIFHQYLGIPLSQRTAPGLARTIESAVRLQPFVEQVEVRIDPGRGGPVRRGRYGYRYLTAEMLEVTVGLRDGPARVDVRLAHRRDLDYPLMTVLSVRESRPGARRRTRSAPRSGRTPGRSVRRTARSGG